MPAEPSLLSKIPRPSTGTASKLGWSFLSAWKECRRRWYDRYLRPLPQGTGAEPLYTPIYFLVGSGFHAGVEAYRLSGWQDGQYDVEAGIEGARATLQQRRSEVENDDTLLDVASQVETLLLGYHDWWGPNGQFPDWPEYQVAATEEGPLIEVEMEIPLGYRDYVFTTRFDGLYWYRGQYLCDLETKTSDVSRVAALKRQWERNPQGTGQWLIFQHHFPTQPWDGIHLDIAAKRARTRPFERVQFQRDQHQLEAFRRFAARTLQEVDDHIGQYEDLITQGMDYNEAARVVFDDQPPATQCDRCPFSEPCNMPGYEADWFGTQTRVRSPNDRMLMVHHTTQEEST